MKIAFSKEKPRHLVFDLGPKEAYGVADVVREVVLQNAARPVLEARSDGGLRYRFHKRYFLRLFYTFPFAELSPGVRKFVDKLYEPEDESVEPFDIPWFREGVEPYPFQYLGIKHITDNPYYMLNDEMGLGKTIQALGALCLTDRFPALVVCPNNAKYNWAREIERFTELTYSVVDGTRDQRVDSIYADADVTIVNFESLRIKKEGRGSKATYDYAYPELFDVQWENITVDEFHRVKNPTAQQTRGFFELQANSYLLMSGTPFLNRPEEMFSAMHKLRPDLYANHWMFEQQLVIRSKRGYTIAYQPERVSELKDDLHAMSLRRRKEQVRDDLPEVVHIDREVELKGEQKRLYNQIFEEAQLELASGEKKPIHYRAQITRLKQAAFSPELYDGSPKSAKIDELKDIVAELVANGEKAIIFTQWAKAGRILERELAEYNPAYVDGSVKDTPKRQARTEEQDRFNYDDSCKLYIGTIGANKEAINLGSATYVIFTDKDWVPNNNNQAIARSAAGGLRGAGQKKVTVISLLAKDTVEAKIEAMLATKSRMFTAVAERDSGAQQTRTTIESLQDLFAA